MGSLGRQFILQVGFKIHHNYVEDFSLGAWQAFGNTWKGVSKFVYKINCNLVTSFLTLDDSSFSRRTRHHA
ncbi:hypothetical protein LguiB_014489 [Lonicera macranthoides]